MTENIGRILFVISRFKLEAPEGKITYNLARSLMQMGFQIDVICVKDDDTMENMEVVDGVHVYRVDSYGIVRQHQLHRRAWLQQHSFIGFLIYRLYFHLITDGFLYKRTDARYMHEKKFHGLLRHLFRKKQYEAVISISHPFYIQKYVTKYRPKCKWIALMTDPHADNIGVLHNPEEKTKNIADEVALFQTCDCLVTQSEIWDSVKDSKMKEYSNKVHIIPLPVSISSYKENLGEKELQNEKHFVYAGRFYVDMRNPEMMLRIWKDLPDEYILDLYSNGCQEILSEYTSKHIISHGSITMEQLQKIYAKADILVNLGNASNTQTPSKVLEYIFLGKPIINLYTIEEDTSAAYLKKYPLSLSINIKQTDATDARRQIMSFTKNTAGKKVNREVIWERYCDYLPETIARQYIQLIK